MIKIIYGAKGTGKTKAIISEANDAVGSEKGNIVFVSDTSRYMYDINREVRFVNAADFEIKTELGLLGFIRGLIAGNADISKIYIDGAARLAAKDIADMKDFYAALEHYSENTDVNFILTVSASELPPFIKKYVKQ